jgi:hypothetical protein
LPLYPDPPLIYSGHLRHPCLITSTPYPSQPSSCLP